jgi:hypothetical protein
MIEIKEGDLVIASNGGIYPSYDLCKVGAPPTAKMVQLRDWNWHLNDFREHGSRRSRGAIHSVVAPEVKAKDAAQAIDKAKRAKDNAIKAARSDFDKRLARIATGEKA